MWKTVLANLHIHLYILQMRKHKHPGLSCLGKWLRAKPRVTLICTPLYKCLAVCRALEAVASGQEETEVSVDQVEKNK